VAPPPNANGSGSMASLRVKTSMSEAESQPPYSLSEIAALSRKELIDRLLNFKGTCPLDFTEDFLAHKTAPQLRHILVAAHKFAAKANGGPPGCPPHCNP